MTNPTTQDLLKKINYIEADIEIQKQILFSIPSKEKGQMEKTIKIIAEKKEEIEVLRQEIQATDPEEFQRIVVFEEALAQFKTIAMETKFESILNKNVNEECALQLRDAPAIECLIKACDSNGNWTIITLEGEIRQFPQKDVAEKPPEPDSQASFSALPPKNCNEKTRN